MNAEFPKTSTSEVPVDPIGGHEYVTTSYMLQLIAFYGFLKCGVVRKLCGSLAATYVQEIHPADPWKCTWQTFTSVKSQEKVPSSASARGLISTQGNHHDLYLQKCYKHQIRLGKDIPPNSANLLCNWNHSSDQSLPSNWT